MRLILLGEFASSDPNLNFVICSDNRIYPNQHVGSCDEQGVRRLQYAFATD